MTDRRRDARTEEAAPGDIDVAALAAALQAVVQGEVRFDRQSRALYSTDASNYRQIPIGVVVPKDKEDVVRAVAVCREHGAPILGRGGGTSLAGQCCNVGVVIDFSKYMRKVLEIDAERRLARVQPGCVLDDLRDAAEVHGLTFGPDPATHDRCTLGGMIGNNSCGVHSQMSGRTVDYVLELEVLTYDGERLWVGPTDDAEFDRIIDEGGRRAAIYQGLRDIRDTYADRIRAHFPDIPRRVSGYNLDELLPDRCNVARALVGTESTCVIVLEARLQLIPSPKERAIVLVGWSDIATLADNIPEILRLADPVGLEAFDENLVGFMMKKHLHEGDLELLTEGGAWMLIEFGADTKEGALEQADRLRDSLAAHPERPSTRSYDEKSDVERIWQIRESGLGATARVPGLPDTWPGWEDAAVPPEHLGDYLRRFRALLDEFDYSAALYGHFGHGCVHTRLPFDLETRKGIDHYLAFIDRAADLVASFGGSFSGEHGDGQSRGRLLVKMYGEDVLEAMRRFKTVWDPLGRMNPGKVVDALPIDHDLRLGADYRPWEPETVFSFQDDEGRFSRAASRCVGVGVCRDVSSGTMCPSYMVTLEEKESTRGRARLLFEMLQGDVVDKSWDAEPVKDSLDLCLSCKGCLGDCPVNVDMATYKAEFLHHYYKKHRRPRHAYAFGYVDVVSRLASKAPRLVNLVTQTPLARVAKRAAGIAPERRLPPFAKETFRDWFERRDPPRETDGRKKVILWPDTFTNHFHTHVPKAAVEVLEAAGFEVVLPPRVLCCGRPLYDYGMLDRAKRLMKRNIRALRYELRAGTPMVGVEPSCVATFRDELPDLFPKDQDAMRLSQQTFTLGEFLHGAPEALRRLGLPVDPPERTLDRTSRSDAPVGPPRLIVQRHCHHDAVMGFDAERAVLDRLGVDYEVLDSGCCGLAGSFGFEAEHHDISMRIGERVLLPRVREMGKDTRLLADGFSCRTQVRQGTRREGLHLAELLAEHIQDPGAGVQRRRPVEERSRSQKMKTRSRRR